VIDATNADYLRHALITALRRQIELAGMMEDSIAAAFAPTGSANISLRDVSDLAVTLSKEALDQAEQITWP